MNFLPYERVSFRAAVSAEEVLRRLDASIEPATWFRMPFATDHKPYQGERTGHTFKVTRVIHYRNSFLPTVVGEVHDDGNGAVIEATLSLNPWVLAFLVLWLGFVGLLALMFGVSLLSNGQNPAMALAPTGMFLFGYALTQGGFWFEAAKAKRFLAELAQRTSA